MKKYNLAALILSIGINSSYAGTMGPVNDYDFGGFYIGLQAGALTALTSLNMTTITETANDTNTDNDKFNFTATDVAFNGNIGYGIMFNQSYLGLKGAVTYSPIMRSATDTDSAVETYVLRNGVRQTDFRDTISKLSYSLQPIYNLDLVLGYELFPHVLPYIEGGVSWTNPQMKSSDTHTYRNLTTGASDTETISYGITNYSTGWNVGTGLNYQPHPNWILTSEFIYTGFGNASVSPTTNQIVGRRESRTFWLTENDKALSLMAGITYLFN